MLNHRSLDHREREKGREREDELRQVATMVSKSVITFTFAVAAQPSDPVLRLLTSSGG